MCRGWCEGRSEQSGREGNGVHADEEGRGLRTDTQEPAEVAAWACLGSHRRGACADTVTCGIMHALIAESMY